MADHKKMAMLLGLPPDDHEEPDGDEPDGSQGEDPALMSGASDLIDAIKSGDASAVADALKAAILSVTQSSPEEQPEGAEEEAPPAE